MRRRFKDHLAADAALVDQTTTFTTIGVWGPRARDIVQSITRADMSKEAFKSGTCRNVEIGSQVTAWRASPTGRGRGDRRPTAGRSGSGS